MWITCGLLLCFISCLNFHSDGTHSLQRIYWWSSDVMLHFSKSVPIKKQTLLHFGWHEGEYIFSNFYFCVNYSLKSCIVALSFFIDLSGVELRACFVTTMHCPIHYEPKDTPVRFYIAPILYRNVNLWNCIRNDQSCGTQTRFIVYIAVHWIQYEVSGTEWDYCE